MTAEYSDKMDGKDAILARITEVKSRFPDYENDLADLEFYISEDTLGNGQAFLLRIGSIRLQVSRNEPDKTKLAQKLRAFFDVLLPESATASVSEGVQVMTTSVTSGNPVPEKDTLYWRDVTVFIVMLRNVFRDTPFEKDLKKLRLMIHKDELGKKDYSLEYKGAKLNIKKGDSENGMLVKLSLFVREMKSEHASLIQKYMAESSGREVPDQKDRQQIWSDILANLSGMKKVYKGSDFGLEIAELKDLINVYQLGYYTGVDIVSPFGVELHIEQGESLDSITEKLARFIGGVQEKDVKGYPNGKTLEPEKSIASKEEQKFFWTDVIAGLDILQRTFPAKKYPALQALKEMMENNELAQNSSLFVTVGDTHLQIKKTDNDKAIKNKVSVFIGELKQVASALEDKDKLDDIYWRDVLAQLRGMEDAYGDNSDYQLLIMSVEAGTLGTVRDFHMTIDGENLSIEVTDSDKEMKEKIQKFIDILKNGKKAKVDEQVVRKTLERVRQMEDAYRKMQDQMKIDNQKIAKQTTDIRVRDDEIRQLRDEIKQLKRVQISPPSRSSFG